MTATVETHTFRGAAVPRHALVVIGMHRSGTSAVAGVLARLGADLPARLMVPTPDNPKGYFEADHIRLLNDRILTSAGSSWDDWTRIPEGWFAGPRAASFRAEASDLLATEFGHSPLFVLKDPRICRLWPFWRDVLAAEGIAAHTILTLRNPLEVEKSLARRDAMAPALARLIWLRHQLDAEHATRDHPRVMITYDGLLANWRSMIAKIEAVAGFAMPRRSPRSETEIADFLAADLRHSRYEPMALAQYPNLPAFLPAAFRLLAGLAEDDATSDSADRLDAISADLDCLVPVFHEIGVQAQTRQRDAAKLARECHSLTARVGELTTERDTLTARVDKLTTERDTLTARVGELATERSALTAELADRTREIGKMALLTVEREALFAEKAMADLKAQEVRLLTEVHASTSWMVTAPLRGASRLMNRLLRPLRQKRIAR